jgi:hypothetical protein
MADRYWVGGSGTWNNSATANWSASSGGAGGASLPTATDNVFFDSNSGSGNYTVTTGANMFTLDFNITQPATGTLTFAGNGIMNCAGNLNCNGGNLVWNVSSNWSFNGTGTQTVKTGGVTFSRFVFNGGGTTFVLQDTVTVIVNFQLSAGTLNFNGQTVNSPIFSSSGATVRTLDFTSGGIVNLSGNSATVINGLATTNLTILGTSVFNLTYAGSTGTRTVSISAGLVGNFNINVTAGSDLVVIGPNIGDLDFTGFSGTLSSSSRLVAGNLTLSPTMTVNSGAVTTFMTSTTGTKTITTNGIVFPQSFTINGAGGTFQLVDNLNIDNGVNLTSLGLTAGNLNLNNRTVSAAFFNGTGSTARSIAFGANSIINLSGSNATVWSAATVTNFSYTGNGRVNFTYAGSTGTRTIAHGSTSGGSNATKAPPFYITAGTDTVAASSYLTDFVVQSNVTLTNQARTLYGNLIFNNGMTLTSGANAVTFGGNSTTQLIDSANLTLPFPIIVGFGGSNGTVQFANAVTLSNTLSFSVNSSTLYANGYNLTAGSFVSSNGNSRTVNISNTTVTLNGTGTVWNTGATTGLTLNASNSTILMNDNSNSNKFLNLGNLTYNNVVIGGSTSTAPSFIYGNGVTIGTLSSTRTVNQSIFFSSGNTYTVNNYNVVGTSSASVALSGDAVTPFNLIYGGAGNVNVSYHTITYSNGSPSNTWYSLFTNNNSDGGNNTGWIFTIPNPTSSNFFLVF